jgi:hypothetical protein
MGQIPACSGHSEGGQTAPMSVCPNHRRRSFGHWQTANGRGKEGPKRAEWRTVEWRTYLLLLFKEYAGGISFGTLADFLPSRKIIF